MQLKGLHFVPDPDNVSSVILWNVTNPIAKSETILFGRPVP